MLCVMQRADMAIAAITITPERESVVDFTKRYLDYSVGILMSKSVEKLSIFSLLAPFDLSVWVCLCTAVPVVGVIIFILRRVQTICSRQSAATPNTANTSLLNTVWIVYGAFTQQGVESMVASVSVRIALGSWWLFTLIVCSSYTANLTVYLTTHRLDNTVRSLQDLAQQSGINYGTVRDSAVFEYFKMKGTNPLEQDSTFSELWRTINKHQGQENCVHTLAEGIRKVKQEAYVFLWDIAVLEYAALTDDECSLTATSDPQHTKGYGIALQHGSPHRDILSHTILELQQRGDVDVLKQKWWPRKGRCINERRSESRALTLHALSGVFCLLALGLFVSGLVGALESWYTHTPCRMHTQDKEVDLEQVQQRFSGLISDDLSHKQLPASPMDISTLDVGTICQRQDSHDAVPPFPPGALSVPSLFSESGVGGVTGRNMPLPLSSSTLPPPSRCKHRAPNGGILHQSPIKMPVKYQPVPSRAMDTSHGTSI
ncbi:hypothetical protein PGIGA_G00013010 [Pangasianodon gigas]|uniref:Uncharacterized protein n=1 Tax=Pangasianodon gigas TaxID=30993 RepID=A0ACC5WTP1_PANGG|nr:hypothetical protein [Pangasianodon gigas]